MAHAAQVCPRCTAPLPPSEALEVTCVYCGTVSRRQGATRAQVKAVVREVLEESRRPPASPGAPVNASLLVVVALVVALFGAGLGAALFLGARRPTPVVKVTSPRPLPPPEPPRPPPAPAPKPAPMGSSVAVGLDEAGDVVAMLGSSLVKADAKTLELKWATPTTYRPSSGAFVFRGPRVVLVSGDAATFIDSKTGALVNTFAYRSGGILERLCAVGDSLVQVDVLGAQGLMAFDATTGQKVARAQPCAMHELIGCPAGQRCGWEHAAFGPYECRYALTAGGLRYRSCDVDDGQRSTAVVAMSGGQVKWKASGAEASGYFGLHGQLVIAASTESITALDAQTGAQKWQRRGHFGDQVASNGERLFVVEDDRLTSIDVATGEVQAHLHHPDVHQQ